MKQIQIENGVIRYYGNRVGRVTEGCAVVDPMFQNEALESFLRKQRNIQKIQWQDGIYDRLANSQEDMESAKGLKDVRIWQLRGDVDVHMKFLALSQMEQQYGSPKPDFYIKMDTAFLAKYMNDMKDDEGRYGLENAWQEAEKEMELMYGNDSLMLSEIRGVLIWMILLIMTDLADLSKQ